MQYKMKIWASVFKLHCNEGHSYNHFNHIIIIIRLIRFSTALHVISSKMYLYG